MTRKSRTTVLTNDQEQKILEMAAKAAGVPLSTYIRMAALEKARKETNG